MSREDDKKKKKKEKDQLLFEQLVYEVVEKSLQQAVKVAIDDLLKDFK